MVVRAEDFVDGPFGRASREPGNVWAFTYYLPRAIPRDLHLGPKVVAALSGMAGGKPAPS